MNAAAPAISLASMVINANAAGDAALQLDFDEARFRTHLLMTEAEVLGFSSLAEAAADLAIAFGPFGARPSGGYGAGMFRLAEELDAIGFTL